jgi:uncharacterized protein (DUF2141 family)
VKALAAALIVVALPVQAATLTVKVDDVSSKGGNLRLGLFDANTYPVRGSKPINGRVVPATAPTTTVLLEGIEPGIYAVKVLDDENANGKMDFNFGIVPAEPYGISNDPKVTTGLPAWDAAKIEIKPGSNAITIHLH